MGCGWRAAADETVMMLPVLRSFIARQEAFDREEGRGEIASPSALIRFEMRLPMTLTLSALHPRRRDDPQWWPTPGGVFVD